MSEDKKDTLEKVKEVTISAEDCNAALDFWRHFDIEIPASLTEAVEMFSKDPSFENQQKIKFEVCKEISTKDHPAFRDEMFQKISEECASVTFDMSFDQDVRETLTVPVEE